MNIQAYITSGILELYVLGLASAEEVREVEDLASKHPEIRLEIDAIRQALDNYAIAHRAQPPQDVKAKILDQLSRSPQPAAKTSTTATKPETRNYTSDDGVRIGKGNVLPFMLAVALIAALAGAWYFFGKAQTANQDLRQLQAQYDQFKKDCEEKQQQTNQLQEQFIAIRHWSTKAVPMKGTQLSTESFAVVYWNNVKRTSFIDVVNLPTPPTDKQYQLWAIVDGKPTDMGVFELKTDTGAMQAVPFIENPQAFAVTLENKGGSPTPTLDQMYVIGNVAKG
jgi:anti-sigma-K factor RskA